MTQVFLTAASSSPWIVPSNWTNTNTVEAIGEGGSGGKGFGATAYANGASGGSGGGGAYAKVSNLALSGSVPFQIGVGGTGQATYFLSSAVLLAQNGTSGGNASSATAGAAGAGGASSGSVGDTTYSGGAGAIGGVWATSGPDTPGGSGGGGAAGPNGAGNDGATTSGFGVGATGGSGDAGLGGAGGTSQAAGGAGTEWSSVPSYGSGGGGGGGDADGFNGGAGGAYGGGGGGGGYFFGVNIPGGVGAGGLIVITYTPTTVVSGAGTITGAATVSGATSATKSSVGKVIAKATVTGATAATKSSAVAIAGHATVQGRTPTPGIATGTINGAATVSGGSGGIPPAVTPLQPVTVQDVVYSYIYKQYEDDPDLQASRVAYNQIAQGYLDSANNINLAVYTGLTGSLLDWVATNLYGYPRPTLSYGTTIELGAYNEILLNQLAINASATETISGGSYIVNDDIYKRCLAWHFFKGDGKTFSIPWLKRRVHRFLNGPNGTYFNVDNTYDVSVTISSGTVTISLVTSSISSTFAAAVASGVLELPFQYIWDVTLT